MKFSKIEIYCHLMIWGHRIGCHQLAERSFTWHGLQFPVCARCTGVLLSYVVSIPLYIAFGGNLTICISTMAIMFADWLIQYLGFKQSTNIRRLLTGICGGYGVMTVQLMFIEHAIHKIISFVS